MGMHGGRDPAACGKDAFCQVCGVAARRLAAAPTTGSLPSHSLPSPSLTPSALMPCPFSLPPALPVSSSRPRQVKGSRAGSNQKSLGFPSPCAAVQQRHAGQVGLPQRVYVNFRGRVAFGTIAIDASFVLQDSSAGSSLQESLRPQPVNEVLSQAEVETERIGGMGGGSEPCDAWHVQTTLAMEQQRDTRTLLREPRTSEPAEEGEGAGSQEGGDRRGRCPRQHAGCFRITSGGSWLPGTGSSLPGPWPFETASSSTFSRMLHSFCLRCRVPRKAAVGTGGW